MDFKILASLVISNCLEGNTMRNRGAYSTKERMPSVLEPPSTNQPGRLYLIGGVLPSRQKLGIGAISPAHPRFSRMYGVTNSTVFQTAFVLATVLLMSIAKNLLLLVEPKRKNLKNLCNNQGENLHENILRKTRLVSVAGSF